VDKEQQLTLIVVKLLAPFHLSCNW